MAKFFINRPIVAMVISIIMVIAGGVVILSLPTSLYPNIAPPEIQVKATYTGADALTSETFKKNFQEAYPGDALKNLWSWPAEPSWFAEIRSQYVDKFKAA